MSFMDFFTSVADRVSDFLDVDDAEIDSALADIDGEDSEHTEDEEARFRIDEAFISLPPEEDDDEDELDYDSELEFELDQVRAIDRAPVDIYICGLPGAGKTELITALQAKFSREQLNSVVIPKPNMSVLEIPKEGNVNLSDLRLHEPKKWSYMYHSLVCAKSLIRQTEMRVASNRYTFIEGSPDEEFLARIPASEEMGYLTSLESYALHDSLRPLVALAETVSRISPPPCQIYVYVDTSPVKCEERSKERKLKPKNDFIFAPSTSDVTQDDVDAAEAGYTLVELHALKRHYDRAFDTANEMPRPNADYIRISNDKIVPGSEDYTAMINDVVTEISRSVRRYRRKMIRGAELTEALGVLVKRGESLPISASRGARVVSEEESQGKLPKGAEHNSATRNGAVVRMLNRVFADGEEEEDFDKSKNE